MMMFDRAMERAWPSMAKRTAMVLLVGIIRIWMLLLVLLVRMLVLMLLMLVMAVLARMRVLLRIIDIVVRPYSIVARQCV